MRKSLSTLLTAILFLSTSAPVVFAQDRKSGVRPVESLLLAQIDIVGPVGSGAFGTQVLVLSNNNIVITDPGYDDGAVADVGAVYLYDSTGTVISTLKGSTTNDQVGSGGVTLVGSGNFVVRSPNWDNGATSNVGAVTWVSGTAGLNGNVSATNSLVGSTASDQVGSVEVFVLANNNYLVRTPNYDNGAATNVGAVTFGLGNSGVTGAVTATNSLVGSTSGDGIGSSNTLFSPDGDYLVLSPNWDNGAVADVGAATFGSGTTGISGVVSTTNSLVGSTSGDKVGLGSGTIGGLALSNGNFVVRSANWDNGGTANAGAVTWVDGSTGLVGTVSAANSLVGNTGNIFLGAGFVTPLVGNSNYVVLNRNGNGSATWCDGATGRVGAISSSNSIVGSAPGDFNDGQTLIHRLSNGNYVVSTPGWDSGAVVNAGAVTLGNGTTGTVGTISSSISLVGSSTSNLVGYFVTPLTNGNYVVGSIQWDNGATLNVGAVTWGDGTTGTTGIVSTSNSIVGTVANDTVGSGGIIALTNGNYVIVSQSWDNGAVVNAGAATWASGTGPTSATVSAANSLVGTSANDNVGGGIGFGLALTNGNYVIPTPSWDNGATANVGAVTWGNGTTGIIGAVSASNSLVGTTANDQVGSGTVRSLSNGNYIVLSTNWSNAGNAAAGAVTLGDGAAGTVGSVSSANSLVGTSANDNVGVFPFLELSDGRYIIWHYFWNNGTTATAGAWTFFDSTTLGPVSSSNSVVGNVAGGGFNMWPGWNDNAKWAIGRYLENIVTIPGSSPTSARAKIEGKAVTSAGRSISGAKVSLTDSSTGVTRTVVTNTFGKFVFEGLDTGSTYVVEIVNSRRHRFTNNTRALQLYDDVTEMVFTAEP